MFSLETLVNPKGSHVYVPIKNGSQIVGVKELTLDGKETSIPNSDCKGVLLINSSKKKSVGKEVIIVHSVRDTLALGSVQLTSDIICLPHGKLNLYLSACYSRKY